jgi:hypothetical protein
MAMARRDDRIFCSRTSSPISSRLFDSRRMRVVAVGGTTASCQALVTAWTHACPLRSNTIISSRRSCISRVLGLFWTSSAMRLRSA